MFDFSLLILCLRLNRK